MRYLTETLDRVLMGLGLELEPWMAPLAAVCVALCVLPLYRRNFKTKQARKRVQAAANAAGEAREALMEEAMQLVAGNPFGLMVVAEEADTRGVRPLALRALEALEQSGKRRLEVRILRAKLLGDKPTTAEAEAVAIENLRSSGLEDQAAARLEAARARFGDHEALNEPEPASDQ